MGNRFYKLTLMRFSECYGANYAVTKCVIGLAAKNTTSYLIALNPKEALKAVWVSNFYSVALSF